MDNISVIDFLFYIFYIFVVFVVFVVLKTLFKLIGLFLNFGKNTSDKEKKFILDLARIFKDFFCKPGIIVLCCALMTYWICWHSNRFNDQKSVQTHINQQNIGDKNGRD